MKNKLLVISILAMLSLTSCGNVSTNTIPGSVSGPSTSYEDEEPYVVSLELLEAPKRTSYLVGELFDPTGILIKANWSHTDPYGEPLFEDDIKKNDLSHWTPDGPLKLTDKVVTVYYEGKSLDIPITVDETTKVKEISVSKQSVNYIKEGETLKMSSLNVNALYSDGKEETVTGYTIKKDGSDVTETLKTGIKNLIPGRHEFEVHYQEVKTSFFVYVLASDYTSRTTRLEADNIVASPTSDTRNYVEQTDSLIPESDGSVANGSNGMSLSKIFLYTTVKVHYYSDVDGKVSIMINGASTSRNKATSSMTDIYLKDVMSLKLNSTDTNYDSGAYFKGLGSSSEWFKWCLTYFGTFNVKKGDNVFEMYMFDEQAWPNSKGSDGGATLFNLDYFDFIRE